MPDEIQVDWPYSANGFKPTEHLKNKWRIWHELDVQFEQIDILEGASFPYDSLIWVKLFRFMMVSSHTFDAHFNVMFFFHINQYSISDVANSIYKTSYTFYLICYLIHGERKLYFV